MVIALVSERKTVILYRIIYSNNMKKENRITVRKSIKDNIVLFVVKGPKNKHLFDFLEVLQELALEFGNYRIDRFYIDPKSSNNYCFESDIPWDVFIEIDNR
jgi:hypothetical protein